MSFATSDLFDFGSPVKMIKHDGGLLDIQSLTLSRERHVYYLHFSSSFFILYDALVLRSLFQCEIVLRRVFFVGGVWQNLHILKEELRFLSTNALLTITQTTT
jgi:hypothetical protein